MQEAPWWVIPLLTFVGVLLAQAVVVLLFFARQRAEDQRRWHERRLETYAVMSRAARDGFNAVNVIEGDFDAIDHGKLAAAMERVDECALDIALLSSEPVRDAAVNVQTLLEMCQVLDPSDEGYPEPGTVLASRYDFENAVRRELGIKTPKGYRSPLDDVELPDPDELDRQEP